MPERQNVLKTMWRRPWARRLTITAGVLVFLLGLIAALGPMIVRSQAERALTSALERQVHIGGVTINPLNLSASVRDVRIDGLPGDPPMFELQRAYARVQASSLFRGAVILSALKLEQPRLHVARLAENRYSFSDILERLLKEPAKPDAQPTRFALYNFELDGGDIRFDDRPAQASHHIGELSFALPFISNIPADVKIEVQPRLSALVDGARLTADGETRPFAETPEATLNFKLEPLDLVPLMAYLPVTTRLTLAQGRLDAAVQLKFRQPQDKAPELALSGQANARDWKIVRRSDGGELGHFTRFGVDLAELNLNTRHVHVKAIEWQGVDAALNRDKEGRIDLVREIEAELAGLQPAKTDKTPVKPAAPESAWTWLLDRFALSDSRLAFADATVTPAFAAVLQPVALEVDGLSQDLSKPAKVQLSLKGDAGESVNAQGSLAPQPLVWDGGIDFAGIQPARSAAYLKAALPMLQIDKGVVEGHLPLKLADAQAGVEASLSDAQLKITDAQLRIKDAKQPFLKFAGFALEGVKLDQAARKAEIGKVALKDAQIAAQRGKDGRFDVAALAPAETHTDTANKAAPSPSWQYRVGEAEVAGSALAYTDLSNGPPLRLSLTPLSLQLTGLSSDAAQPSEFKLKTGWNKKGQLSIAGRAAPQPLHAALKLDARSLDLVPILALFTKDFQVSVTSAALNARGNLNVDTPPKGAVVAAWKGDLSVANLNSIDLINNTSFVRWQNFSLQRVAAKSEPLSAQIGTVALSNFQTRLILDAEGNLNLREMTRKNPATADNASAGKTTSAEQTHAGKQGTQPSPASPSAIPPIRIERIVLAGGDIRYSDRFVKPNFDANLRNVQGTITNFGTDAAALAQVNLQGAVDGSAPLQVTGQFAPFRQDRYLDIKAGVNGFELTSLSAYAGKYVGYGIEKGKLSLDLLYQIKDRKLTAENHLFLDQLTFGDKVESPDATSLPVQLAVSLLKNSRGEIDIRLPIAGTLDDPEFSFGGLVWTMIGNFFKKIVTAPFSFLGGGGGQGDLEFVGFPAGSSKLSTEAQGKLESVAKALLERPALKLEITGVAGADELDALKRQAIQRQLRALKMKQLTQSGGSTETIDDVQIPPEDYAALLERVYKDAKFDKPRNMLGFVKGQPPEEMEKLLIEHSDISAADLPRLAQARGNAVKSWLVDQGQVPAERIFLLAPKAGAEQSQDDAKSHGVSFSLR
ncbi:MAG: DUF748 domain-containing protein [Betaproteobacteria bacterium]|nr:DUF748 domain-containing protein [Betaproteobacteria bacterium]